MNISKRVGECGIAALIVLGRRIVEDRHTGLTQCGHLLVDLSDLEHEDRARLAAVVLHFDSGLAQVRHERAAIVFKSEPRFGLLGETKPKNFAVELLRLYEIGDEDHDLAQLHRASSAFFADVIDTLEAFVTGAI